MLGKNRINLNASIKFTKLTRNTEQGTERKLSQKVKRIMLIIKSMPKSTVNNIGMSTSNIFMNMGKLTLKKLDNTKKNLLSRILKFIELMDRSEKQESVIFPILSQLNNGRQLSEHIITDVHIVDVSPNYLHKIMSHHFQKAAAQLLIILFLLASLAIVANTLMNPHQSQQFDYSFSEAAL